MKKILNFMKKKIKMFSFLSMILLIVFVKFGSVLAGSISSSTENYKEERQFIRKIEIIHEAFPNQTDVAALYATVAHRGISTGYVKQSYDPNFDEEAYSSTLTSFKSDINSVFGDPLLFIDVPALIDLFLKAIGASLSCGLKAIMGIDEDGNEVRVGTDTSGANLPCMVEELLSSYLDQLDHTSEKNVTENVQQPRSIDLLIAATIIMLDSSSWVGTYSDQNYMKALAGEGLVGNMFDGSDLFQSVAATIFNGVFCGVSFIADVATDGAAVDIALTGFKPSASFTDNEALGISNSPPVDKVSRYYTMAKICSFGFLGGTYQSLQNYDLDDEEQKERYQAKKNQIAEEIIQLANYYRKVAGSTSNLCVSGVTGAFSEWKQYDDRWANVSIGSSTVRAIGCTTTSIAIQIARSGTQITNLPSGYTEFNPGALATSLSANGGYTGQLITWGGYDDIAPNVKFTAFYSFVSSNESEIASKISEILQTPILGQYQPFVILQMRHNGGEHWVAVQGVENGQVVINDPGRDGTSLSGNYSGEVWQVEGYKIMYATDVPFGSSSSSGSSSLGSSSSSDNYCTATSGNIVIPEEFGNGGYTVTFYLNSDNLWNWDPTSNQGNFYYNYWLPSGAQFDNGIAVYEGRYLIACTETFGKVGDKIDFFLDDGTRIPCIIADAKRVTPNENSNEWGHNQGQNVIEFEVSRAYYNKYGNPGSANWFPEWAGKRVSSATNLGENVLGI